MKKALIATAAIFALSGCNKSSSPDPDPTDDFKISPQTTADPAKQNCDRINQVYSTCGQNFAYDGHQFTFKVGSQKKTIVCTDGRQLGFFDRVDDMDVSSIFMFDYLLGNSPLPEVRMHYDAGRLRVEELLKQVYGYDESSARTQLVKVKILGQTVPFSKSLGAADALRNVDRELQALMKTDPQVKQFLEVFTSKKEQISTFFWRVVAGTTRLSAHSFGAAIDLLTNVGPEYWLWDEQETNPERAKQGEQAYRNIHFIPKGAPIFNQKVVDVLERNGFIWGGKWNHYDSMHFEYRPEFNPNYKVVCPPLHAFSTADDERMSDQEIDAYLERIGDRANLDHED